MKQKNYPHLSTQLAVTVFVESLSKLVTQVGVSTCGQWRRRCCSSLKESSPSSTCLECFEAYESVKSSKSRPIRPASEQEGPRGGLTDETTTRLTCICAHSRVPGVPGTVTCHRDRETPVLLLQTAKVLRPTPSQGFSKDRHRQPALADLLFLFDDNLETV